jgi:Glycosyl hydrolases family 18
MSKRIYHLLLIVAVFAGLLQGCGDPITNQAKSRGTFKVRNWLRYEFKQLKTFSYGNSQIKENQHVIGYEPSWLIYDSLYINYPFQLLSDLVIGEYDLNPNTGFARNDSALNAFRNKDIVELGTSVNEELNVLLALTDYSDDGYRAQFLAEVPKKNLMNSLDLVLNELNEKRGGAAEREHVGILVDFPNVSWNHRFEFADFLARIKKDLNNKELGKSCLLYLVLPPNEEQYVLYKDSVFAAKVRQSVDLFVLRTHGFDSPILEDAKGTMMPIDRPGEMLDIDSVVHYYNRKAHIPLSKITLEVPYYCTQWTDSAMSGTRPMVPLNELFNTVVSTRLLDTLSMAFKYKLNDSTIYFFQDTLSLNIVYDWVVRNKLGGIGIYGLGYGHGIDNPKIEQGLWQVVADNFGEPAPRLFFPGVGYLLCFFGVGVIVSVVNYWQVRYALRARRSKLGYYAALLFFIILAIVLCVLPIEVVPIMWKLISLVILLIFPLGRKAFKYFMMARR